jgi:ketosteroid isomerase-like protein
MDSTDSSLDLIRRWVDAVNARDLDALLQVADDEVLCRPLSLGGGGGAYIGHDGLRRWIARLSPDLHVRCDSIRALEGGLVVALGVLLVRGRLGPPWALVAATRDGKVVAAQSYFSDEHTLTTLGLADSDDPP